MPGEGRGVLKFRVDRRINFGVLFVQIKSIVVLECSVTLVGFLITFLKLTSCRMFLNFLPFPDLSSIFEVKSPVMMTFFLSAEILSRIGKNLS